jgi:hypothetical protein
MITDRLVTALKRRRNTKDTFRMEHGYSWDYVIVFKVYGEDEPVSDKQCMYSMRHVLQRLAEGGMEVRLFYSLQVRISTSFLPAAGDERAWAFPHLQSSLFLVPFEFCAILSVDRFFAKLIARVLFENFLFFHSARRCSARSAARSRACRSTRTW